MYFPVACFIPAFLDTEGPPFSILYNFILLFLSTYLLHIVSELSFELALISIISSSSVS